MTKGQTDTFKAALKEARETFDKASDRMNKIHLEAARLTDEISRLRRTITALAAMCSEEPLMDKMGITPSCLEVMNEQYGSVKTADVVLALEARGFDVSSQKNAQASVHAILNRLAAREHIQKVVDQENDTVLWRGPKYDPDFDSIPF